MSPTKTTPAARSLSPLDAAWYWLVTDIAAPLGMRRTTFCPMFSPPEVPLPMLAQTAVPSLERPTPDCQKAPLVPLLVLL